MVESEQQKLRAKEEDEASLLPKSESEQLFEMVANLGLAVFSLDYIVGSMMQSLPSKQQEDLNRVKDRVRVQMANFLDAAGRFSQDHAGSLAPHPGG